MEPKGLMERIISTNVFLAPFRYAPILGLNVGMD